MSVLAAACDSGGTTTTAGTYWLITHSSPENSFWGPVQRGMNDAAAEHSAAAEFKGAADPSMPVAVQQAAIMREAIDLRIDGIGLTVTDPVVLGPLIRQAVAAEIPVVALNIPVSDEERVQHDLPILAYVGQIERPMAATAALRARDTLAAKGRTMDVALCVQGSVAEPWAIQRCEGMAAALEPLGVRVDVLAGDFFAQPPNVPTAAIETWFADNPDVDYVFSTATSVLNLMLSLQSSGKIASEVLIGSVDLNEETLDAIETGRCDFAVDQQPYLQGYMTVQLLSLNLDYALRPGGDIPTGPFFVTADNVATIKQLVSQGIR